VPGPGRRDALRQHLAAAGINTEIYYPLPLHHQECFGHLTPVELPVAEQFAGEVVSIPVFPELTDAETGRSRQASRPFPDECREATVSARPPFNRRR